MEYFGLKAPEELTSSLKTNEVNWRTALENRGITNQWRLTYCNAYGIDPHTNWNGGGLYYGGTDLDYVRFRTNLTRPKVRQSIMLALGERPKFSAIAINNDVASLSQVNLVNKLMDYVSKETALEHRLYEAVEADRYFGEGYLWLQWNPYGGDEVDAKEVIEEEPVDPAAEPPMSITKKVKSGQVTVRRLFPWQVVKEQFTESMQWCIVKEAISKYEVVAMRPELADKIEAVNNVSQELDRELFGYSIDTSSTDVVILRHFYHKPCPLIPKGRHVAYLDDIVIWDRPCPIADQIPLVNVCTMKYFGTSLGFAEASDLIGQQELLNEVTSQLATNLMKFGNQSLFGDEGVDFDPDEIAKGGGFFTLKEGQNPPRAIQWASMPDISKFFLEYIPGVMNQISGLNDTVLGKPDANVKSGTAMALLVNMAEKYQGATQATADRALTDCANMMLQFIRSNADNGYPAEVSGISNSPYLKYFTSQDLKGIRRIQIERANPLLSSIPVRTEIAMQLEPLPKDSRRAVAEMMLTGSMDALLENDHDETMLIRWENEQLSEGRECVPNVMDDPKKHVPSHQAFLNKLRCMMVSDQQGEQLRLMAMATIIEHIKQHADAWLTLDATNAAMMGLPLAPIVEQMAGQAQQQMGAPLQAKNVTKPLPGAEPEPAKLPSPAEPPKEMHNV